MDVWATEKDATNNQVMCPQVYQRFNFQLKEPIREEEDCLYLNIFVPISTVSDLNQLIKVEMFS